MLGARLHGDQSLNMQHDHLFFRSSLLRSRIVRMAAETDMDDRIRRRVQQVRLPAQLLALLSFIMRRS
jgi:hypothetical protein